MRIEGWETKLNDYFESVRNVPFEWGACDCLIFASDAVKICTGIDPMSKKKKTDPDTIRGMYKTQDEARELIKKYRKSIRDVMDVHFVRQNVNFAKRGDIVFYNNAFGVCSGRGNAFFKNESEGLQIIKLSDCVLSWRVE